MFVALFPDIIHQVNLFNRIYNNLSGEDTEHTILVVTDSKEISVQSKNIISVNASVSYLDTSRLARYSRVADGSYCERVTSKKECEEAARLLNVSEINAREETENDYPPFCYLYKTEKEDLLYFNKHNLTDSNCNSDHICICRKASGILGC